MNRRLSIFVIILFFLLPVAARAQVTGSFRFAQLTDIHLNPNNPKPTEDLKRSVEQINATPGVDFVLVTGDLTEEGDRTTMLVVKSILDRLKVKYYVIPGNHETKWSDSGCTAFSEIFGGERFKFEHKPGGHYTRILYSDQFFHQRFTVTNTFWSQFQILMNQRNEQQIR